MDDLQSILKMACKSATLQISFASQTMNRSDMSPARRCHSHSTLPLCTYIYVASLHSPNCGKHLIKLATLIQLDDTTHRPVVASSHKFRPYKKENKELEIST